MTVPVIWRASSCIKCQCARRAWPRVTTSAAIAAAVEMAVAYYIVHWPRGWWPIENRGESALLYFLIFVFVAARGGGRYSLDRIWRRRG